MKEYKGWLYIVLTRSTTVYEVCLEALGENLIKEEKARLVQ